MTRKGALSAALIFAVLFQCFAADASAAVKDERLGVKASETEQLRVLLANQKVEAGLADGTRLRGRVNEVNTGTIVIHVESSEGTAALPRGAQSIATDRFNTLEMTTYKGKKRWIWATALAAVGAVVGLGVVASETEPFATEGSVKPAGVVVATAAVVGGAAGGYAIGRNRDKKRLTIVIVK